MCIYVETGVEYLDKEIIRCLYMEAYRLLGTKDIGLLAQHILEKQALGCDLTSAGEALFQFERMRIALQRNSDIPISTLTDIVERLETINSLTDDRVLR